MTLLHKAEGIDVSNNNGRMDWPDWRGAIQFAEIKATDGIGFSDPEFTRNWQGARDIGLYRFAYHYAHPSMDPSMQARFFTETVRKQGLQAHDHFVLDLEESDGLAAGEISFWGEVFCHEMNRLNPGHRIIVQMFPDDIEKGYAARLGAWHLWIMSWGIPKPVMPVGPWKDWALWQYASSGVDRDRFNGPVSYLKWFCESTGPEGP